MLALLARIFPYTAGIFTGQYHWASIYLTLIADQGVCIFNLGYYAFAAIQYVIPALLNVASVSSSILSTLLLPYKYLILFADNLITGLATAVLSAPILTATIIGGLFVGGIIFEYLNSQKDRSIVFKNSSASNNSHVVHQPVSSAPRRLHTFPPKPSVLNSFSNMRTNANNNESQRIHSKHSVPITSRSWGELINACKQVTTAHTDGAIKHTKHAITMTGAGGLDLILRDTGTIDLANNDVSIDALKEVMQRWPHAGSILKVDKCPNIDSAMCLIDKMGKQVYFEDSLIHKLELSAGSNPNEATTSKINTIKGHLYKRPLTSHKL